MKSFLCAQFEKVPLGEHASFVVREIKVPAFGRYWHFHPEYELTYIVRGRGKRFVGDHIAAFGPGDLVLLGPNLPHYWYSDAPGRGPSPRAYAIVVQFLDGVLGEQLEMKAARRLLGCAPRGLRFHGGICGAVADKMRAMLRCDGPTRFLTLLSIFNLLAESHEVRALSSPGFVPQLDRHAADRIHRAHQWVFTHFRGPIYLAEVARAAGMSAAAFCRYFKKINGMTLSAFVNEVRIGHVCKLLIETDQTIAGVGFASGFNNLSNLNRQFWKLKKLTPREYRRQFQGT